MGVKEKSKLPNLAADYRALLGKVTQNYPDATVIALVPLLYSSSGGSEFYPEVDTMYQAILNATNAIAMNNSKVHYVEMGSPTDKWIDFDPKHGETSDWTHPTAKGAKKVADKLKPAIEQYLPKVISVV